MRHRLDRRDFLGLAAIAATDPARVAMASGASPATGKSIVFVPQAMPVSLDPIATPSFATRTAAMAVFETLFGTDAVLNPMPQMVDQYETRDDGKTWLFKLRPGLLFHDGTTVTARDCVASLHRWILGDRTGRALGARLNALEAIDDLTLTLRLTRPQKLVPLMLTKSQLSPPVIMPARLAGTSPDTPVAQIIGSGPFRLANLAWRPGEDLDLLRFEQYRSRPEASSFTGGGRSVMVDRVLWRPTDDPAQSLRDGRADWVEWVAPDEADGKLNDAGIEVSDKDGIGYYAMLRLNTRSGPTASQRIRQAILAGVDQGTVLDAVFGTNGGQFVSPIGLFPPASEFVNTPAGDRIGGKQSPRAIKAMLKAAGYNGEPIVLLNPVDDTIHSRMTTAMIDELTQIGLSIEERKLDRDAMRLWHQAKAADGDDWSALCDSVPCADQFDAFAISAGSAPSGGLWPGWTDDPIAARMREAWIDAPDLRAKRAIGVQLQEQVFTTAAFVPLGEWSPMTAWRTILTGQQKGPFPVFWDIARHS
jgi:peptide/nickel transport system substrate-binding protein